MSHAVFIYVEAYCGGIRFLGANELVKVGGYITIFVDLKKVSIPVDGGHLNNL